MSRAKLRLESFPTDCASSAESITPTNQMISSQTNHMNGTHTDHRVHDLWAAQISDSDDDNWFVPKFSKRRVASSIHSYRKAQNHSIGRNKNPPDQFCDVDLKSSPSIDVVNADINKQGWSNSLKSKLLPAKVRRKDSSSDEVSVHSNYLPPFQIVGHLESEAESGKHGTETSSGQRGSVYCNPTYEYEEGDRSRTRNQQDSLDTRDVNASKESDDHKRTMDEALDKFSAGGDPSFEDSDCSWVLQASNRRLVRCTKDSAVLDRRRSLVEQLLGSIYPRNLCRKHASMQNRLMRRNQRPSSQLDSVSWVGSMSDVSEAGHDCPWCCQRSSSYSSWLADDSDDTLTEHSTTSDFDLYNKRRSVCQTLAMKPKRRQKLWTNSVPEVRQLVSALNSALNALGSRLLKQLKRRDNYLHTQRQRCEMITALLHALSAKTRQDTKMRFSVLPLPGDSGFSQWHSAMTMCARLPEGIPPEFRKRLWLTLAEHQLRARKIEWGEVERRCFNQHTNPDDDELGDQIVKDLHRTGCSLFSGADATANQAMLKRVLLAYSRWNKNVGYCQGFNMLAAIILEEVDRDEGDALKVMIYLIEGVLPESYFANNLRGLSVDMAVFRDLLRMRLPVLSKHLDYLRQDSADQNTGTCYEPPLTNVFTMQWFLTLFSNCLPKETVMRVWDLTFLQGNEVLLRTALAIWDKLAPRILAVHSADEFYTEMGGLTHQMLTPPSIIPPNALVQSIVGMAPFPLPGLSELRDRYAYNITPWTIPVPQSVSTVSHAAKKGLRLLYDEEDSEEDDEKMAVAAAFGLSGIFRKTSSNDSSAARGTKDNQTRNINQDPPLSKPNLDISALKKQYARLRERQKQAHVILTASQINMDMGNSDKNNTNKNNKLNNNRMKKRQRNLTSHIRRNVSGLTNTITSNIASNLPSNLTGRNQNYNLHHNNITKDILRRNSMELKLEEVKTKASAPLTMNHLLRGKTALTSKTKRVVARGLVVVPPAPKKKPERKMDPGSVSPHHPQPSLSQQHSFPLTEKKHTNSNSLLVAERTKSSAAQPRKNSETLLWKDVLQRRASLPSGVKLLDDVKTSADVPETVGEEENNSDENSNSTSTELCDEDDETSMVTENLPLDNTSINKSCSVADKGHNATSGDCIDKQTEDLTIHVLEKNKHNEILVATHSDSKLNIKPIMENINTDNLNPIPIESSTKEVSEIKISVGDAEDLDIGVSVPVEIVGVIGNNQKNDPVRHSSSDVNFDNEATLQTLEKLAVSSEIFSQDNSVSVSDNRDSLANSSKVNSIDSQKVPQSPTNLSRSSSISKRSLSSSSISPRSPRTSFYDDESSFELCREAESIRKYIDSEFLSNLLLKGEMERASQKRDKENCKSPKLKTKSKHVEKQKNKDSSQDEQIQGESLVRPRSPFQRQAYIDKPENCPALTSSNSMTEITIGSILQESAVERTSQPKNDNERPTLQLPSDENISQKVKINLSIETNKSESGDISHYIPVTTIFSLNQNNPDQLMISSSIPSPTPSPTFSRSSFALNSQFLRSLSASTQELLNSLAVSSPLDMDNSPSPTHQKIPLVDTQKLNDSEEIELVLPTLAPTTSLAIHKLFNTSVSEGDRKSTQNPLEKPNDRTHENSNELLLHKNSFTDRNEKSRDISTKSEVHTSNMKNTILDQSFSTTERKLKRLPIACDSIDEDILQQERALDDILVPLELDSTISSPADSCVQRSSYSSEGFYREVPTLQELASASLPSCKPVSSAILSFNSCEDDYYLTEKTHLHRRYNSPETQKSPCTRLSLRDKFESDLRTKTRHKHTKSLSKNARFQKGPKSRVTSQENKEKCGSKLDKSKSESRIGETMDKKLDDCLNNERVRSDGSLESKRQTTVKFAPLNVEIPNYRDPEIEIEDIVHEEDKTSDAEDFLSPSDEITAELIRKRLWAGLRSFSVDADILQAYGILGSVEELKTASDQVFFLDNQSTEAENENGINLVTGHARRTSMTAEDLEYLEARKSKRRGSVAALQELVKENTLLMNQISKQNETTTESKEEGDASVKKNICDRIKSQLMPNIIDETKESVKEVIHENDFSPTNTHDISVDQIESKKIVKNIIVTHTEDKGSGCFNIPLSAFCVNSHRNDGAVVKNQVVNQDDKNMIVDLDPKKQAGTLNLGNEEAEPHNFHTQTVFSEHKNHRSQLDSKNKEGNQNLKNQDSSSSSKTNEIVETNNYSEIVSLKTTIASESTNLKLKILDYQEELNFENKNDRSRNSVSSRSSLGSCSSRNSSDGQNLVRLENKKSPTIQHVTKPITFNPFPKRNSGLHRKEVPLKLGLYSSTTK